MARPVQKAEIDPAYEPSWLVLLPTYNLFFYFARCLRVNSNKNVKCHRRDLLTFSLSAIFMRYTLMAS
jgi:hypothetical protein